MNSVTNWKKSKCNRSQLNYQTKLKKVKYVIISKVGRDNSHIKLKIFAKILSLSCHASWLKNAVVLNTDDDIHIFSIVWNQDEQYVCLGLECMNE